MFSRFKSKRIVPVIMLGAGIISLAFGVIAYQTASEDAHDYSRFLGMLAGFGSGIIAVAVFYMIRARVISPEKRKQQEIEQNDERNIALQRAALAVAAVAGMLMFAALAFAFTAMGYPMPSYICLGAMYLQVLVYLAALRVYKRRM